MSKRTVAIWLIACAVLVYSVLIVGGITRLTHSGLSIVEWQPLVGALPPMSDHAWAALFEKYRTTPEYKLLNSAMTLGGFKEIFWWEYSHRLLGRLVGLVFLLPLVWFIRSGIVSGRLAWQLAVIFVLGTLQGALGWYMVASGLADNPHVSAIRLAAHLGLALLLIGAMLWTALGLWSAPARRRRVPGLAAATVAVVLLMALTGAMVAGTRAGFAFNTFPLMGGSLAPSGLMQMRPWYLNFTQNVATIQFVHRAIAWTLLVLVPTLWWWIRRTVPRPTARLESNLMLATLLLQVALGISTLLSVVALPLAAAHQAGAVLLYAACLWTAHALTIELPAATRAASGPGLPADSRLFAYRP